MNVGHIGRVTWQQVTNSVTLEPWQQVTNSVRTPDKLECRNRAPVTTQRLRESTTLPKYDSAQHATHKTIPQLHTILPVPSRIIGRIPERTEKSGCVTWQQVTNSVRTKDKLECRTHRSRNSDRSVTDVFAGIPDGNMTNRAHRLALRAG